MQSNVHIALGRIDLMDVQKFARRAKDYRHGYKPGNMTTSLVNIEKARKLNKTHRCTYDQDYGWLGKILDGRL